MAAIFRLQLQKHADAALRRAESRPGSIPMYHLGPVSYREISQGPRDIELSTAGRSSGIEEGVRRYLLSHAMSLLRVLSLQETKEAGGVRSRWVPFGSSN